MIIPGDVALQAQASITDHRPVWVLSHPHPKYEGSMHNKVIDQLYRRAVDQGISVLRYNFRGVGESQGSYDEGRGEKEDLLSVLTYLDKNFTISTQQVHLIGYSFGSWISAHIANEHGPFAKLSLIGPPTDMVAFPKLTGTYPVSLWMPEHDEYTAPEKARTYFETIENPKTFHLMEGSDHFFVGTTKKFITAFFADQD